MFILILYRKTLRKNRNIPIFSAITLAASLMALEIILQAFSLAYPRAFIRSDTLSPALEDNELGHRPNPEYPGHDSKGFRNNFVPDTVSIVALGDSQTYGTSVLSEQAWPKQLESLTGLSTYSMAYGGYGPAHSLVLLDEAISLRPKLIIEAFYSGNDLFDSYSFVYNMGKLPYLKARSESVLKAVELKESTNPILEKLRRITGVANKPAKKINAIRIAKYSKILAALQVIKANISISLIPGHWHEPKWDVIKKRAMIRKDHIAFESGNNRTVFTAQYRLCALDMEDPRISEGLRISLNAMLMMKERANKEGVGFMALLIPTKEFVFKDISLDGLDRISEDYEALVRNEEIMWKKAKEFLREHDIDTIDSLPTLRNYLHSGNQPYFMGSDGHPRDSGHLAIAELVTKNLDRRDYFNQNNN